MISLERTEAHDDMLRVFFNVAAATEKAVRERLHIAGFGHQLIEFCIGSVMDELRMHHDEADFI